MICKIQRNVSRWPCTHIHTLSPFLSLPALPSFPLFVSQDENVRAYRALHRCGRDEEMPIFVSHRYFQRAMQRRWNVRYAVQMHRCLSACWACIVRPCASVYAVYILHRLYLPTRSLSLLEIYLPRELNKWENISTYTRANAAVSNFVFRLRLKKKRGKNYLMVTTDDTL